MAAAILVISLDSERPRKQRKWWKEWFLQRGNNYGHASLLKELRIKEGWKQFLDEVKSFESLYQTVLIDTF